MRQCFYFVVSVLFYHVFNLLYFSNAAAKPFLLYSEVIFSPISRLAYSSPVLFLLKLFISPGRTGGLFFAEETKKKDFPFWESLLVNYTLKTEQRGSGEEALGKTEEKVFKL